MEHKIAVIAGDGIGPEVLAEGVKVLNAVAEVDGGFSFDFTHFPWGCEYYLKEGRMMAEDGMEQLKRFDAIFLGHVEWEQRLIDIIEELLVEKAVLTPDMGGVATTAQVGDEVVRKIREKY